MKIIRSVLLKGATVFDLINEFFALLGYGILALVVAVWQYRKVN